MTGDADPPGEPYGSPREPPLPVPWQSPPGARGDLRAKGWAPLPRLALWWVLLFLGDVVFYGLRAMAWIAELRSRTRG